MVDRATNIKVRIDVKDAMGKITQMKQGMTSLGATGQQAGTQIQQGMNKATGAITNAGNAAVKNAVNFQTMGQGMLNLSTAGVQTFTSVSNLARAENRAEAASLGLQRAQDLLARKTLAYNKIVEAGNGNSREAKLLMDEMTTATNDLAVKTDKLKIEQEAVTDVYLLFGANLMNVGVSSLMIYKSMMDGVTKASVLNSLVTAKNTLATKINSLSKWNNSKSLMGNSIAYKSATFAIGKSTLATRIATVATKALNFALGPVGLIIMGISAALVAYETNFMGFKDGINGFLGIQEEFNEGIDDGTAAIDAQTASLTAQTKAFDDLSPAMQHYITMQEKMARQNNDPREIIRLAKLRGGYGSGFSTGGGTAQFTGQQGLAYNGGSGGQSAFDSGNDTSPQADYNQFSQGGLIPSAFGSEQKVEQEVYKHKPQFAQVNDRNPFGNTDEVIAFYSSSYPDQRDTLLMWIDNTWDMPGTQKAYIDKYWEIFDISNGFTERKKAEAIDPNAEWKKILANGNAEQIGSFKSVFAAGYGGKGSIFNFDLDDNRAIIKQALGVDVGAIANTVNITDAIRFANMKLVADSFVGIGGRGQQAIDAYGGNATAAYQIRGSIGSVEWRDAWEAELKRKDEFVNSGGSRLLTQGREIFQSRKSKTRGGVFTGGRNSYGLANALAATGLTRQSAMIFGSDVTALAELEAAESKFFKTEEDQYSSVKAAMFAIEAAKIADRRIDRVEGFVGGVLGIDFNANSKEGIWHKSGGSKNRPLYSFQSTSEDLMTQIRKDIGVSQGVSIPSAGRLESIAKAFNENGSFSNFNNVDITGLTKDKLGLTEQKIFDIRFESTRGDRELLNRLRYVERIEAASSGTAPI